MPAQHGFIACPRCGKTLNASQRFCNGCGSPVEAAVAATAAPAKGGPQAGSLLQSLASLGLQFTKRQLIGMGIALVSGMIASRIWPYVFPAFDPITRQLMVVLSPFMTRETLNSNMMTLLTFLASFLVSFAASFTRRRAR
jgi:hypothetical protein